MAKLNRKKPPKVDKTQSRRKFFQYKKQNLIDALNAIKTQGMKLKTAAEKFGVPRTSLRDKMKTGGVTTFGKMGPNCILGPEVEKELVDWMKQCAASGFPIDKDGLAYSIKLILDKSKMKTPFKNNVPGERWFKNFMRRHPELSMKKAEYLSKARAAVTRPKIEMWFQETRELLGNNISILENPDRVWNMDESAFFLNPEGSVFIAERGKNVYKTSVNSDKDNITTLICVNASGVVGPPLTIYKFQRLPKFYAETAPKEWSLGTSDSGWMTAKNFYEYFANVFHPWLRENNYEFPIIVFLDGHSSHLSLQLSKFCRENEIVVVCLPPNTTHLMQPLDVAVFGPMKKNWLKKVRRFCYENGHEIKKHELASVLKGILSDPSTASNIKSGFRKCGLVPFDHLLVDYGKCLIKEKSNDPSSLIERAPNNGHLEYLEEKISPRLLNEFKQCRANGTEPQDVRSQHLFNVWLEFITDSPSTYNFSDSLLPETQTDCIEFDFPELENSEIYEEEHVDDAVFKTDEPKINCDKKINIISDITLNNNISNFNPKLLQSENSLTETDQTNEIIQKNHNSLETMTNEIIIESEASCGRDCNITEHIEGEDVLKFVSDENSTETNCYNKITDYSTTQNKENLTEISIGKPIVTKETTCDINCNLDVSPEFVPRKFLSEILVFPLKATNMPKEKSKLKRVGSPSVLTSDKWLQIAEEKEREKENLEQIKRIRKEKREQNKKMKEHSKRENKQLKIVEKKSNQLIQSKDQSKPHTVTSEKIEIKPGNFVIVIYNGTYYPGKVVKTIQPADEYVVSTMEKSGVKDWKWPAEKDEIKYSRDEIITLIEEPKLKTQRGTFTVPEMEDFVEFNY